ncbi:hypothetical protein EV2_012609 [Malus domestica]
MLQNGTLQPHVLATHTELESTCLGFSLPGLLVDTSLGSTQLCWAPAAAWLPSSRLKLQTDNIRDYTKLYTKDHFLAFSLVLCLLYYK